MSSVGTSEPEGMLKGWNSTVRTTTAINSAWTMTLTVSRIPPSRFSLILPPTGTRSIQNLPAGRPGGARGLSYRSRSRNAASLQWARLDDHESLGERGVVGERHINDRLTSGRSDGSEALERAAGKAHRRAPAGQVHDLHVAPEHAPAHAGAERLGAGLLRCEAPRIGFGPRRPPVRAPALALGEDAPGEALAEALERAPDAADVAEVRADAENQRPALPSSMARRIARTASSRPMNTASQIRKWPMLSSTTCGIAATMRAVSKVRPWPAWISRPSAAPCAAAALSRASSCRANSSSPAR